MYVPYNMSYNVKYITVTVHGKTSLMGQKIDFEILCLLDSPESAISKTVYKIKIREVYPEILTI